MSVELEVEKDLNMLVDINDVNIGMARAAEKYDGVITRTDFLGKNVAPIYLFDLSRLSVRKHVANPPISPKKPFDDLTFLKSLKVAW